MSREIMGHEDFDKGKESTGMSSANVAVLPATRTSRVVVLTSKQYIIAIHLFFWAAIWLFVPWKLLPTPAGVLKAFSLLWSQGFAVELYTSFMLNLEVLAISSLVSCGIIYFSMAPWIGSHIRLYSTVLSKFRFMGLVGWSLAFTIMLGGGHYLKVALMTFAMSAFMVTAMASVVVNIPKERFDHARTLRMGEWRVLWEVVVRGTFSDMFDVIRQNAAIGWTMLTMVEGLSRSEGGVGVMLLSQNKFFKLDAIFAIQLTILFLALAQDYFLMFIHKLLFPYAYMGKEGK